MGELADAIEATLAEEESAPAEPVETPEPQETDPALQERPDNTVLEAGVEVAAKAEADAAEAQEAEDAEKKAALDKAAEEAEGAEGPGGDRQEAGDAEAPEEEADEAEPEVLTSDDVPEDMEFPVKVDGETSKVSLKDLKDSYQLRVYADRQIKEARETQGALERTRKALMQDPLHAVEQLYAGMFGSQDSAHQYLSLVVGKWMQKELEFEQMPPEQKEIWRKNRELELERRRFEEERTQTQQAQQQNGAQAAQQQVITDVRNAMEKLDLGDSREVERAILIEWRDKVSSGIQLTAEGAANIVKQRREKAFQDLVKTLPSDELIQQFPEFAEKVREADRKRVKEKKRQALSTKTGEAAQKKPTKPVRRGTKPKFSSSHEYFDELAKKFPK
jgi:hypothetical protein